MTHMNAMYVKEHQMLDIGYVRHNCPTHGQVGGGWYSCHESCVQNLPASPYYTKCPTVLSTNTCTRCNGTGKCKTCSGTGKVNEQYGCASHGIYASHWYCGC